MADDKKSPAAAKTTTPPKTVAKRPTKAERRAARRPQAPFGWDVIGEDGRKIARSLPKNDAQAEANRISSMTGEQLDVSPSEIVAPSVAIPDTPAE